jgi:hypothetical protein
MAARPDISSKEVCMSEGQQQSASAPHVEPRSPQVAALADRMVAEATGPRTAAAAAGTTHHGGINWIALLGNIDKVRSVIVAVLNALHDQGLLKDQPES